MHAQATAARSASKSKKVIQPRRDWHTMSDALGKHNSSRLTGQFIVDLFNNGFVCGGGYFCVHAERMAQYLKNDTKLRLTKFQRQGCQLMTEELPLELRLRFKRMGYRLLLDNSGFLQKLAAESNMQIPIEYLCDVESDTHALVALGLIDGQDKPLKTKRTIPAAVIGHIQLLIHANGGAGDLPQYLVDPVQQTAAYYYSDENASPCMSHESVEPLDSQSFPSEGSDSTCQHDGVAVHAAVPLSPATQQLLHAIEFSAHSSPDIYLDESRSDLSISSDGASNFSAADVDLFFAADYTDELLDSSSLNFV